MDEPAAMKVQCEVTSVKLTGWKSVEGTSVFSPAEVFRVQTCTFSPEDTNTRAEPHNYASSRTSWFHTSASTYHQTTFTPQFLNNVTKRTV